MASKANPMIVKYETLAKNLLKGELKRRGMTYAGLAEALVAIGLPENKRNLNNKISRGGFTAAFFLQALAVIGVKSLSIITDTSERVG
jgi:hypothetical protein